MGKTNEKSCWKSLTQRENLWKLQDVRMKGENNKNAAGLTRFFVFWSVCMWRIKVTNKNRHTHTHGRPLTN